ncbi:hypothetical protein BY458DRAFT_509880 [Sporodiniella umbellata]|nr:hypothetical protein BY458DRAFT_509880 [Sporodiniella umbellata]
MLRLKGALTQERLWSSFLDQTQADSESRSEMSREEVSPLPEPLSLPSQTCVPELVSEADVVVVEDRVADEVESITKAAIDPKETSLEGTVTPIQEVAIEAMNQEAMNQEVMNQEAMNQEATSEKAIHQETVNREEREEVESLLDDRPEVIVQKRPHTIQFGRSEPPPRLSHASTLSSSFSIPSPTTPPVLEREEDPFRPVKTSLFRRESTRLNNKRKSLTKKIKNIGLFHKLAAH